MTEWGQISDPSLARDLVSAGVPLDRVGALRVYPAIYAAWADDSVRALETLALVVAAARAELERPEVELVLHWAQARPPKAEVLLDLSWRLYESVPALQQRCAPDLSWSSARMVARCSGGILRLFSIGERERLALETISGYAAGVGLETARRVALRWEAGLEREAPGLRLVSPSEIEAGAPEPGQPLSNTFLSALLATQSAPDVRVTSAAQYLSGDERRKFLRAIRRERDRDLLPTLREAFASLSEAERELIGAPGSLTELAPWQACKLALLIVTRSARAPEGERYDVDDLIAAQAREDTDYLERFLSRDLEALIEHDRALTPALLRSLVDGECVGFVCRHYVRMVCALFRALRHLSSALKDSFLIPLYGVHDSRVRQAHAWCLFVEGGRGIACPLDPAAADSWWDAGHAESFLNPLLPALDYANLSALLIRLLRATQGAGLDAACELVSGLPLERRALLGARLLVQWPLLHVVGDEDFEVLLVRAADLGAPPEFLQRARELRVVDPETLSRQDPQIARARLGRFLAASGFLAADDLPPGLRS